MTIVLLSSARCVAQDEPPSFTKDIRPFLTKYCMECHKSTNAKAGLSVESYDAIMKGSKRRKVLVAGKPEESRLLATIEGKARPPMPPRNKQKPGEKEVALLRSWIAAGAKDDTPASAQVALPPAEWVAIDLPSNRPGLRLAPAECRAGACPTDRDP
jgi:hypothetical protein